VEQRGWIRRAGVQGGPRLCAARPGPLAAQLAIYSDGYGAGCSVRRWQGIAFVSALVLMVLVLSELTSASAAAVDARLFYGSAPPSSTIIARSALKTRADDAGRDHPLWIPSP